MAYEGHSYSNYHLISKLQLWDLLNVSVLILVEVNTSILLL